MDELIDWTNIALRDKTLHPLLVIAIFTVVFLEVHPFEDGVTPPENSRGCK